ncbi:unnamed protein product [Cunninghamella echinulata]
MRVLQHYEREQWAFQKLNLSLEIEAQKKHIVYLIEAKTLDDAYCLTLPFYPHTLLEVANRPWPRTLALTVFRDLVQGVQYIHQQGVAHCDLSLSNILLDSPPQFTAPYHKPLIIISDFGCAHPLVPYYQPTKQLHGADIGTRQFKAPEHLFGSSCYTEATDVWSLGVMLAHLFLGRLLYPSQGDLEQMGMIVKSLGRPSKIVVQQEMINYPDTKKLWFFGHDESDESDDEYEVVEDSSDDEEETESFLLTDVLTKANIDKVDQDLISSMLTWSVKDRATIEQILHDLE